MSVSERRIYRTLVALLPSGFRARNSAGMEDLFAEALAESRRRGRLALLGTWLRGTLDIMAYGVRARLLGRREESSGARAGSAPTRETTGMHPQAIASAVAREKLSCIDPWKCTLDRWYSAIKSFP